LGGTAQQPFDTGTTHQHHRCPLPWHSPCWRRAGVAALRGGLSVPAAALYHGRRALRLVCREFLAAMSEQPWKDRDTVIKGSIAAWRACFPRARRAKVQRWDWLLARRLRTAPVVDADFVHFEGLQELYMAGCQDVTDAAFVHLRDIHTLNMTFCGQQIITDATFAHLAGIQRLSMWACCQPTITDAAF
jgi:hypothetical protein